MQIELWVGLAVGAGLASVVYNTFFRQVLKDGDPLAVSWWFETMRAGVFLLLCLLDYRLVLSVRNLGFLVGLGLVETLSIYFYSKMHAFNELSISTVVSRMRVVWIPMVAFVFLGERLSSVEYLGISLVFVGLLSIVTPRTLRLDKGLKYALVSSVIVAFLSPGIKYASVFASTPVIMFFFSAPSVVVIPILMRSTGKRLVAAGRHKSWWQYGAIGANVLGMYLLSQALRVGDVSLVSSVYQTMSVVSVLVGIVLLRERADVVKKLVGAGLAVAGSVLLVY